MICKIQDIKVLVTEKYVSDKNSCLFFQMIKLIITIYSVVFDIMLRIFVYFLFTICVFIFHNGLSSNKFNNFTFYVFY